MNATGIDELLTAVDALSEAGKFDRDKVAMGLARLVERQAKFQALRRHIDPRFVGLSNEAEPAEVRPR